MFDARAVLFDLDGTLIDSAADIADALNELLAAEARPAHSLADVRRMIGEGVHRLMEKAFAIGPGDEAARLADRFVDLYDPRATRLTAATGGAFELLRDLKARGVRMAVCTNKPDDSVFKVLADLGMLSYFDCVFGGSCGLPRKPDPAMLLEAARRLGAAPAQTVMVGDSLHDVAAARAAGIKVVALRDGYGEVTGDALAADAMIDNLSELQKILRLVSPAAPYQR